MSHTTTAIVDPRSWTNKEDDLGRDYYWTTERGSLKKVLEACYNLTDVNPVWARDRKYAGVQFIFEGKVNNKDKFYYCWCGYGDMVAKFVATSLEKIGDEINMHGGGEGHVGYARLEIM